MNERIFFSLSSFSVGGGSKQVCSKMMMWGCRRRRWRRRRRRRCGSRFREFSSSSFCVFELGDDDPEKWKGEKNCAVVSVCCPNNMYTYGTDRDRHVCAESLAPAHEEKKSTHVSLPHLRRVCGLCDSLRRACLRREGVWGPNNGGENISGMSPPLPPPFSFWRMRVCVCGGGGGREGWKRNFSHHRRKKRWGRKLPFFRPRPSRSSPPLTLSPCSWQKSQARPN